MDDKLSTEDMSKLIVNALRGHNAQIKTVRTDGRGTSFNLRMPNDQIFRVQIEEIDD